MGRPRNSTQKPSPPLTDDQKLFARKLFKLRVHESKGFVYQQLFEKIMGYRYTNEFLPIKPYGNTGDRKNDGYRKIPGIYYQVFAPEQPAMAKSAVTAAKKAKSDFNGLKKAWSPINEFRFVFNDEYMGCPPDIAIACDDIAKKNGIAASPFLAHHLEDEALQLTADQLQDVINAAIPRSEVLPSVDFSALREVIVHVLDNQAPLSREVALDAPDLSEKIKFNGLTAPVGSLLSIGSWQSDVVNDYFSRNSVHGRQLLRNKLNGLYLDSKRHLTRRKNSPDFADLVFFELLIRMIPADLMNDPPQAALAQDAALVVLSYYFEACDVFESPNAAS